MKTYREIMEVMSMQDMNQITGGTEAQRKIAQDRQRRREAKNRGFDPNKEVLADKPKQKEKLDPTREAIKRNKPKVDRVDSLSVDVNKLPTVDQIAKDHGVKKPTPLTKATASKDYAKNAAKELESKKPSTSSAIVKSPERKPDFRKSQIGKWSQGVKNSPGKLAKKSSSIVKPDDIKKVDVKDLGPNKDEKQKGNRPGTTRPDLAAQQRKKITSAGNPPPVGKAIKNTAKSALKNIGRIKRAVQNTNTGGKVGTSSSGDLEGLSGRDKGLIG